MAKMDLCPLKWFLFDIRDSLSMPINDLERKLVNIILHALHLRVTGQGIRNSFSYSIFALCCISQTLTLLNLRHLKVKPNKRTMLESLPGSEKRRQNILEYKNCWNWQGLFYRKYFRWSSSLCPCSTAPCGIRAKWPSGRCTPLYSYFLKHKKAQRWRFFNLAGSREKVERI